VIFLAKGITTTVVEEFPLDKITSTQYSTGFLTGSIIIFAAGNRAEINGTVKAHTKAFADSLREHLDAQKPPSPSATAAVPTSSALMDDLTKLAELKTKGLLTDEEFAAAKRKLFGI
jgi:hypothetical protein